MDQKTKWDYWLRDVYTEDVSSTSALNFLYQLLEDRDPIANISHDKMPTLEEHLAFVRSRPYHAWYIICSGPRNACRFVGACYLTKNKEVGIAIKAGEQRKGVGTFAIQSLMSRHPRDKFYANIAPDNAASLNFFRNLRFKKLQIMMEYRNGNPE